MSEPIIISENTSVQESSQLETTGVLGTLGINGQIFFAQLFNFLLVLLVLWRFVYKPLVKALDDRSARIEKSEKQAEEIAQRLAQVEQDQTQLINQARMEANVILEQAREEAEQRKQEILDSAKEEVQVVVAQGKQQLRAEKQQMMREAKEEMIELAIAAAQKILEKQIDEKTSKAMADEVVNRLT